MANSIIGPWEGRRTGPGVVIAELVVRDGHHNFMLHASPFFGIADPPRYAAVMGTDKHYACSTRPAGKLRARVWTFVVAIEAPQAERR